METTKEYLQEQHTDGTKFRLVRRFDNGDVIEGPWCISERELTRWWNESKLAQQIREVK